MKHLVMQIYMLLMVCIVWGCATPYQKETFYGGGYSEQLLDNDTARVSFRGNQFTPRYKVEGYLQYRCAEFTIEQGFDYFVILEGKTESHGSIGLYQSSGRHYAWAIIKLFKGQRPDLTNVFSARELMNDIARIPKLNGLPSL